MLPAEPGERGAPAVEHSTLFVVFEQRKLASAHSEGAGDAVAGLVDDYRDAGELGVASPSGIALDEEEAVQERREVGADRRLAEKWHSRRPAVSVPGVQGHPSGEGLDPLVGDATLPAPEDGNGSDRDGHDGEDHGAGRVQDDSAAAQTDPEHDAGNSAEPEEPRGAIGRPETVATRLVAVRVHVLAASAAPADGAGCGG